MRHSIELCKQQTRKIDENFSAWKSPHTLCAYAYDDYYYYLLIIRPENEKNNINKRNDWTTECYLFLKIASNNLCVWFPNFRLWIVELCQASEIFVPKMAAITNNIYQFYLYYTISMKTMTTERQWTWAAAISATKTNQLHMNKWSE